MSDGAGKGSRRRDNFKAFNNSLYYWLKDNPNMDRTNEVCPECGLPLYTDNKQRSMANQSKLVCKCGFQKLV